MLLNSSVTRTELDDLIASIKPDFDFFGKKNIYIKPEKQTVSLEKQTGSEDMPESELESEDMPESESENQDQSDEDK